MCIEERLNMSHTFYSRFDQPPIENNIETEPYSVDPTSLAIVCLQEPHRDDSYVPRNKEGVS